MCLADPVGQAAVIVLLLYQGRHEVVIALSDFHHLRQAAREESSLHPYASCASLEMGGK